MSRHLPAPLIFSRLVLAQLLWLLHTNLALAAKHPLVPIERSGAVEEIHEVDGLFEPQTSLNQYNTPTCYAHSAAFLLQYFYNAQSFASGNALTRFDSSNNFVSLPQISVIDVLIRGENFEFSQGGGTPFILLHRIKSHSLRVNVDLDLESIWQFQLDFLGQFEKNRRKNIYQVIEKTLSPELKQKLPRWKTAALSMNLEMNPEHHDHTPRQIPYRFLDQALQAKKVQLPPYNLHVFDPKSKELLSLFTPENTPATQTLSQDEILIHSLKVWFRSYAGHAPPLAFQYCHEFDETSQQCRGLHAVNLVGVLTQCHESGSCSDAWHIRGSWGGAHEGWFEAKPLAQAILAAQSSITYIQPCTPVPSSLQVNLSERSTETCSSKILGIQLGNESYPSRKLDSESLASHPLHFATMAGDESLFFSALEQIHDPDQLQTELEKRLDYSKTLAHLAVQSQSTEILKWIAQRHPQLLQDTAGHLGNPAHLASYLDHRDALHTLMDLAPGLFHTQDPSGFYPADLAAGQAHTELLLRLHERDPQILITQNSAGLTPLDILKIKDRAGYDRVTRLINPLYQRLSRWIKGALGR